jgi:hypothetical protein
LRTPIRKEMASRYRRNESGHPCSNSAGVDRTASAVSWMKCTLAASMRAV